jgi:hypothetical protein
MSMAASGQALHCTLPPPGKSRLFPAEFGPASLGSRLHFADIDFIASHSGKFVQVSIDRKIANFLVVLLSSV